MELELGFSGRESGIWNLDRASPPPPLRFDDSPPRHLDALCIHGCVTFSDQESRMPGIQEFCL